MTSCTMHGLYNFILLGNVLFDDVEKTTVYFGVSSLNGMEIEIVNVVCESRHIR